MLSLQREVEAVIPAALAELGEDTVERVYSLAAEGFVGVRVYLEQVLLRSEEIPRPAARRAVIENVDMIRLSRRLTGLDADGCPLSFGPETLRLPDVRALGEVLESGDMPSP